MKRQRGIRDLTSNPTRGRADKSTTYHEIDKVVPMRSASRVCCGHGREMTNERDHKTKPEHILATFEERVACPNLTTVRTP